MRGMMRRAGVLLAAFTVAACAGNRAEGPEMEGAQVRIENDGTIPTQVRVFLVPSSGAEITLGRMTTLGAETLSIPGPLRSGQYRFRAEGGTNYRLTSPIVQLRQGDVVIWEMRRNLIRRP
jgi:hypothetical protein